ncbi:hypothetical protein N665_0174s0003 [Sinapis alba]|nr:hypothetical protein N665_0174s0003 [Sinapis alba]
MSVDGRVRMMVNAICEEVSVDSILVSSIDACRLSLRFERSIMSGSEAISGSKTKFSAVSASVFVSGSSCGDDDDAGRDDDDGSFDLVGNYENWLKQVEVNSELTKEKVKLEAQVVEALQYTSEKEEETRHASAQLVEIQKGLKMLNSGTKQLDHLLRKYSKAEGAFVSVGKIEVLAKSATKTYVKVSAGNATNGKTATDVKNATPTSTATTTALERCHGPICYSCGVQGHISRECLRHVQVANHGGYGLRDTWSRRFDHYRDGEMEFPPYFGGYEFSY